MKKDKHKVKMLLKQLEGLGVQKEQIALRFQVSYAAVHAWSKGTRIPNFLTVTELQKWVNEKKGV